MRDLVPRHHENHPKVYVCEALYKQRDEWLCWEGKKDIPKAD